LEGIPRIIALVMLFLAVVFLPLRYTLPAVIVVVFLPLYIDTTYIDVGG
jgi:hypothetical protein